MTPEGYNSMTVHSSVWIVEYSVLCRSIRIEGQAFNNLVNITEFACSLLVFIGGRQEISNKLL